MALLQQDKQARLTPTEKSETTAPATNSGNFNLQIDSSRDIFFLVLSKSSAPLTTQPNATIYTKLKLSSISCVRNPSSSTRPSGIEPRFWLSRAMAWDGVITKTANAGDYEAPEVRC